MALFSVHGFSATTVDQIADAAGISQRSFFRYFATKEDLVIGDAEYMAEVLVDRLVARPAGESPGTALRSAVIEFVAEILDDAQVGLERSKLMMSTPSLRARHLEKQLMWQDRLIPETFRRLGAEGSQLAAHALVSTVLSCLDVAVAGWAAEDGKGSIASRLDFCLQIAKREF